MSPSSGAVEPGFKHRLADSRALLLPSALYHIPKGTDSTWQSRTWGCDGNPSTIHQRAVGLIRQTFFLWLLHVLVSANPILHLSLRVFI